MSKRITLRDIDRDLLKPFGKNLEQLIGHDADRQLIASEAHQKRILNLLGLRLYQEFGYKEAAERFGGRFARIMSGDRTVLYVTGAYVLPSEPGRDFPCRIQVIGMYRWARVDGRFVEETPFCFEENVYRGETRRGLSELEIREKEYERQTRTYGRSDSGSGNCFEYRKNRGK